jgi:hypothetical protein
MIHMVGTELESVVLGANFIHVSHLESATNAYLDERILGIPLQERYYCDD